MIKQKSLKPLRYRDFLEENTLKRPKVGTVVGSTRKGNKPSEIAEQKFLFDRVLRYYLMTARFRLLKVSGKK